MKIHVHPARFRGEVSRVEIRDGTPGLVVNVSLPDRHRMAESPIEVYRVVNGRIVLDDEGFGFLEIPYTNKEF